MRLETLTRSLYRDWHHFEHELLQAGYPSSKFDGVYVEPYADWTFTFVFPQHLGKFVADAIRLNGCQELSRDLGGLAAFFRPITAKIFRTWPY